MEVEHYNYNYDFSSLGAGCHQVTLSINNQQNTIYTNYSATVIFKVCGEPNADFIIQNVGIEGGDVNLFYPYSVIDKGKLDSDGIHISSIPLNKVGTFIFRAGIYCTVADIDYCTQVSNAIMVTVLEQGCSPNWQCKQPLNGYEYDANYCGETEKVASRCNPGCSGVGCEGKDNTLLKIGAIIAIGAAIYYTSRNGFNTRLRKD